MSATGTHSTYVEEMQDGKWDAACRCGWESAEHEDREVAEDYAEEYERNPEGDR